MPNSDRYGHCQDHQDLPGTPDGGPPPGEVVRGSGAHPTPAGEPAEDAVGRTPGGRGEGGGLQEHEIQNGEQ
jgi:hypothetical protein